MNKYGFHRVPIDPDPHDPDDWMRWFFPRNGEASAMAAVITALILILMLAALALDLVIMIWDIPSHTVSWHLWTLMRTHPGIGLLIGLAIGHLFLPMVVPREFK
jgi:hypothetical protein